MASSHSSKKRRANGISQGSFRQSRHLLDDSSSDEEQETTASRVSGRSSASNSHQYAVMLDKLRKSPVEVPKGGSSVNPTSRATTTIEQCPGTPQNNPMRSHGAQSRMSAINLEINSPSPVAAYPLPSPQAKLPPVGFQGGGSHAGAHSVAAVNAAVQMEDASTLSGTEHENAKAMRLLHEYFLSLQQSGTVRTMKEEKDLITTKLSLIFKKMKLINTDTDLLCESSIARELYKEMKIPEPYKAIWWEQMKNHIRKKLDERRSNCGSAIKKTIISKYNEILLGMVGKGF